MNDILQVLMDMKSGAIAADINEKFTEVVTAVLTNAGKGELTLTLSVKPSRMGSGGVVLEVETTHECRLKKPDRDFGRSVFFVTKEGKLTREDPDQTNMFRVEEKNVRRTQ
jgi:hypothetical protein